MPRTLRFKLSRPRMQRRTLRRNIFALALAVVCGVIAAGLQLYQANAINQGGPLVDFETSLQDEMLRLRPPESYGKALAKDPRQIITIVAMDEKSIAALGRFTDWPRSYYAQVMQNLLVAPPRVVAWDVGFFEPSPNDDQLAAAFDAARALKPPTSVIIATSGNGGDPQPGPDGNVTFPGALVPVPTLASRADIAHANVVPDDRGVVRSMPLLADLGGTERPALGLEAASKYLRRPQPIDGRPDPNTIVLTNRDIPVTANGVVRINYFGPPSLPGTSQTTFNIVSFSDVLSGKADPATWKDGIVFVGLLGAEGFADDYWTPVSSNGQKMAGVEIHANTAATLLSTHFLQEAPLAQELVLDIAIALIVGLLAANLGVISTSLVTVVLLFGYGAISLYVLYVNGVQWPISTPLLAGLLPFMAITGYRVGFEQRQSRALVGALSSVIPPTVAHEIARDPDRVRMGGERRTISVLFTDLKGFTTFSESVDPVLLSKVIGEYLEGMTGVVFRNGGTVDKFIGDAVMAFWNAPLDDPDHARHACESALQMQAALRALSDQWQSEGLQRQQMRIGINTGEVSVGNMGTNQRFAYTALGDAVNLGARLEPLNNEYGTWICISQNTLDAAGGQNNFLVRFLDLVAVKGKKEPVAVYELIGHASDTELVAHYQPILEAYHRGMVLYQQRQFDQAEQEFRRANDAADGGDHPSQVYLERCAELAVEPPAPDWDGVYVMHHK